MHYILVFALLFVSMAAAALRPVDLPPMHHPVNIKPSKAVNVPKDFPLNYRGEIVCETCHGIEEIEDIPFDEVDKYAPEFLREGPYVKTTAFCYRCHEEKAYRRQNIHDLLDASRLSSNWSKAIMAMLPIVLVLGGGSLLWLLFGNKRQSVIFAVLGGDSFQKRVIGRKPKKKRRWPRGQTDKEGGRS